MRHKGLGNDKFVKAQFVRTLGGLQGVEDAIEPNLEE